MDLLDADLDGERKKGHIKVHEDNQGNIYMDGATMVHVQSAQEVEQVLT